MTRWIIGSSLALRFLVLVLAVALVVVGVTQLRNMPVDVYPEFNPPLVEVQTEALGLSAAEMEALITVPLEADLLNGVAWLDQIYSESVVGLSSILLLFEPGTDPIRARQMVQERLTQTFALPNVSEPPTMLQPLSTTSRVMMVGLSSEEVPLIDIGVLARWVIKPRLMGVAGVANVAIWGQREWQLQVQIDPEQLQDRGVTLRQVIETTGEALWVSPLSYLESSSPGTAGWIDTPNQRLSLRHELPISSAQDLTRVPVKGTAWRLGEVAHVVEDHQPLIGDALLIDGPGLLMVVEKFPGANTLEVTRDVEAALEAMQPGLTGIEIDTTVFRPADYIETAVENLSIELIVGAILVILVLVALTFDWRVVVINLVAILSSLLAAILVLHLRGATFNMMILAGLAVALAVLIDDATTAVEIIWRRFDKHQKVGREISISSLIIEALLDIRSPLSYAILIIPLVLLPVFFLEGLTGSFFQPLAISFLLAVVVSLTLTLVITPALTLILLSMTPPRRISSPITAGIQNFFGRILTRFIHSPNLALILAIGLCILSLVLLPFLEITPMPSLKQNELRIQWEGPPGTSLPEMNRITTQVTQELEEMDGIRNVGSHLGRAITGDEVVGIHSGEIWINLDPTSNYDETVAAVEEVIDGYPGLFRNLGSYTPERLGQALSNPEHDFIVRVYGHEFEVLKAKAQEVLGRIQGIDGVVDLQVDSIPQEPQVEIQVDLVTAERYQIKPGDVRREAATLLSGLQVGSLYEEQKVFDVVVWGAPEIRNSLTDIDQLLIDTPRGGHVRLGEVADIRIAPAPIVIRRDAVSRFIDVGGSVDGRSLTTVLDEIEQSLQGIPFPLEYHAEVFNQSAGRQVGWQRMGLISIVVLVGIVLLLQAAFESWRLAFVEMCTIPVALTGGVIALLLTGGEVSFVSIFGFLAVLGVSLRYGVVLLRHFQRLEKDEGQTFGADLVLRGTQERMLPILMTSLVCGLIFLPIVIGGDIPGNEVVRPIAIVILGGLVTSNILNLFILPSLYLRFGVGPERVVTSVQLERGPEISTSSD